MCHLSCARQQQNELFLISKLGCMATIIFSISFGQPEYSKRSVTFQFLFCKPHEYKMHFDLKVTSMIVQTYQFSVYILNISLHRLRKAFTNRSAFQQNRLSSVCYLFIFLKQHRLGGGNFTTFKCQYLG